MDVFEAYHRAEKRLKLFVLYWRRIVFVKDPIHVSLPTKLKANLCGGFLGNQWALYDLNLKKRQEYLSEFDWYRSRYVNEPFDYLLNNKVATTEVLKQYVRVPEIYLVKTRDTIVDYQGRTVSPEEAVDRLKTLGSAFIKPFAKGKGIGVLHLTYEGAGFFQNGKLVETEQLCRMFAQKKDWYLSEPIAQHAYAQGLYGQTLNTIRIITMRNPETGFIEVFFAVQRIGTKNTIPVDNGSQGGLICCIDLETGQLSEGRRLYDKVVYPVHPNSGVQFDTVFVPDWPQIKEEVLELAKHFPYLHFIAWDFIKMPDGKICIIEANTSTGVNIIQLWGGQRHGQLGNFYRAHGVIK